MICHTNFPSPARQDSSQVKKSTSQTSPASLSSPVKLQITPFGRTIECNHCLVSSLVWVTEFRVAGPRTIPRWTNTQGLKMTEENVLLLL